MSECRTQRHLSDTFTDTTPGITAGFFVEAHVFVIDRASLPIGRNCYLGIELPFPEIIPVGLSELALLPPSYALITRLNRTAPPQNYPPLT